MVVGTVRYVSVPPTVYAQLIIVAPMALITAAGGIVTAWDGGPAEGGGTVLAAATPALHAAAMELLA